MAELDEIVQKVALDGDTAVISKLKEIGEQGYEAIKQLEEAAASGGGNFNAMAQAIGLAGAAIAGLTVSLASWVEVNTEAIQKTNFLADSFGAATGEIAGIEAAFAQAGVSAQQFEQFAQRLVVTIARDWPSITQAVRTSATEQDAANERVAASILRVQEAQQNLQIVNEQSSSRIQNAVLAESDAFIRLRFAAQEAYATMVHDINSVQGANLSLEAAEQRLRATQGNPPSAAEKQALQLKQDQLAVDNARQASIDAVRKKQQDQAEAANKAAKQQQEAEDAALKRQTAIVEATTARVKAENAVKEAVTQREVAEEHAAQQAFKNLPKITENLKALKDGNADVAKSFDFSQVSVKNMVDSVILMSAEGNKLPPSGLKVMHNLMDLFAKDTDHVIDAQQRLAIVQQLSQRGFNSTGQAAFELLSALERGPTLFNELSDAAKGAFANSTDGKKNVQEFRDELTKLSFSIDLVNRNFAASAAPLFTKALEGIRESLTSSEGLLHRFVDGIGAIGSAVGALITKGQELFESIDKVFQVDKGTTFQRLLISLAVYVAAFAQPWLAIPVTIGVVITALGYVSEHMQDILRWAREHRTIFVILGAVIGGIAALFAPWTVAIGLVAVGVKLLIDNWDTVKQKIGEAWTAFKDSTVGQFLQGIVDLLKRATNAAKELWASLPSWLKPGSSSSSSASSGSASGIPANTDAATMAAGDAGSGIKMATGGYVSGPGSGTSDSIPARLSNGEFVVRAASVKNFGVDFFNSLNNMMIPGFASGGLVGAPARVGSPSSMQASRPLNLTIDGNTFNGLRGPKSVVDSLASYAVSRQTSSAGNKPSWVK